MSKSIHFYMRRQVHATCMGFLLLIVGTGQAGEVVLPPGGEPCEADWMNRSRFDTLGSLVELKYIESFAERGNTGAQLRLGMLRSTRDGKWQAPTDFSYSIKWLQKAADTGSKSADWELAKLLFSHPKKQITHEVYLRAAMNAAEEGNPWAATYLMHLTSGRFGLGRKPTECEALIQADKKCAPEELLPISSAAKWASIAAEGGNAAAQEWLCQSAGQGRPERGQPQDQVAAYKWCLIASHNACALHAPGRLATISQQLADKQNLINDSEKSRWGKLKQSWRSDAWLFFRALN